MLFRGLNKLLGKCFELQINRVVKTKPLTNIDKRSGNNLIVEFVGPSCIGKTTLCDYYIKNNSTKFSKKILCKEDLARYSTQKLELNGRHDRFLTEKFGRIAQSGVSGNKKFKKLGFVYKFLREDFIIANYLSNKILILDEHLFSRAYNELPKKTNDLEELLKNRLFIHCTLSSKAHIKRIKERSKRRIKPKLYKDYYGKELENASMKQLANREELAALLIQKGARVLEVDVADDLEKNSTLIADFIHHYSNHTS